ncbi:MAG TPA: serine hydrolase [Candidatus Dormibacteraeota bacterium]
MGTALIAAVFSLLTAVSTVPVLPAPAPPPPRDTAGLKAGVAQLAAAAGADVSVSLIELAGPAPVSWSYAGDRQFVAASTYKLPLLMAEAQLVAAGTARGSDRICYTDAMWEDGWYDDYTDGACYTRSELAMRIGQQSDNTAAHMLVADLGGAGALNRYAAQHGAQESFFYDPNTTTANDLARLWADEAAGRAGGPAAQQWLYPLLSHTAYEGGIPAGVQATATVVHKVGMLDAETNDAALVLNGPRGAYALAVLSDGPGGDAGFELVGQVSQLVWRFELS